MTNEEFKFILDRQQSSGLSVRDFCENEALASYVLGQILLLYKIERSADQENLTNDQRADLHKRLALPIWDALEKWMEAVYPTVLPKSRIGEAIAYTYARVPRLKEYAQDGRILIDNNGVYPNFSFIPTFQRNICA